MAATTRKTKRSGQGIQQGIIVFIKGKIHNKVLKVSHISCKHTLVLELTWCKWAATERNIPLSFNSHPEMK